MWTLKKHRLAKFIVETVLIVLALLKFSSMTYYSNNYDELLVESITANHLVLFEMLKSENISKEDYLASIQSLSEAGAKVKKLKGFYKLTCYRKNLDGTSEEIGISAINKTKELQNSTDLKSIKLISNNSGFSCGEENIEKGAIDSITEYSATEYGIEVLLLLFGLILFCLNLKNERNLIDPDNVR
jgi:hypothetical protein